MKACMRVMKGFFGAALCLLVGCTATPLSPNETAAQALAERVVGGKARHFIFTEVPSDSDVFVLEQEGRKLRISGNNANSMAVGLNHYLKYYCHVEYGWFVEDVFKLPARLPEVPSVVSSEARVPERFFLNYCTYGYTIPWWDWKDWEHFIDWMALNGVNLPLAITGQESVWYRVWTEMGLTDEEVRGYFTGPAHLPWHRMQNIDRWGGPLTENWLKGQEELQKHIVTRERELNMRPVLPAFAGHVPRELLRIHPDAPLSSLGAWGGFTDEYHCDFLDPMSDLYSEIQRKFVEKETELYGSDHVYGLDLFNEVTPPDWEPEYLARVSKQVYESLAAVDPKAVWLQMGWLFYYNHNWTEERIAAYLTAFPEEKQIVLDYFCENTEVWQRTDSFSGVPYVWCYLGNFGGNTALACDFGYVNEHLENALANGGDNLVGIGSTLEGFDCNPYAYEFVLEKAWDLPQHQDLAVWTEGLADQRLGYVSPEGRGAWKKLIFDVYKENSKPSRYPFIQIRPDISPKGYSKPLKYNDTDLVSALGVLLEQDGRNSAYAFDLVNMTRELLSNRFDSLKLVYDAAYYERNRQLMDATSALMLELSDDLDRLLATNSYFLLGKWIEKSRAWGSSSQESDAMESNARNLLTSWNGTGAVLNDYARRSWNGLVGDYYKTRWKMFFDSVAAAVDEAVLSQNEGNAWDETHRQAYIEAVNAFEISWWQDRLGSFSSKPVGDSKKVAAELYLKYFDGKNSFLK